MRRSRWGATLAVLALWTASGGAADLSKVERTIAQEPKYQTKNPKYCLLVFGTEAKARVWLVQDGDTLYVDKNGNGDLTEEGERISAPAFKPSDHPMHARERSVEAGDLRVEGLTHTKLTVGQIEYRRKIAATAPGGPGQWQEAVDRIFRQIPDGGTHMVTVNLDPKCYGTFAGKGKPVLHFAWRDEHGHLTFAARPAEAPVLHFGGPLMARVHDDDKLVRGQAANVTVYLGTRGHGPGSFVFLCYDPVPADVYPSLDVEFPPKEPGEAAVTRKYDLKERC